MQKVTLEDIKKLAIAAKDDIYNLAAQNGRDPKIYHHWTAGNYDETFGAYHINITGNGDIYVSTNNFADVLEHTYHRNSGAIGITLCCAKDANTNSLGSYPPTAKQIECMAQVTAVIAKALDITIDKQHVMTHGEAGDNEDGIYCHEPYGPKSTCERWDLEFLGTAESDSYNPYATDGSRGGDIDRGKANFYLERM